MAKLRSHGYEILRIVRERDTSALVSEFGPSNTEWERETRSFRSDGHIMQKLDVRFKPSPNPAVTWETAKLRTHSYGWKLYKKLKKDATITIEQYAQKFAGDIRSGKFKTWQIEYEGSTLHASI
jgi:hypothetical protein